jgi:hypothetical protein
MSQRSPEDGTPLVEYAQSHIWGNPEENGQYQVKLVRVTPDAGVVQNYSYMNRWRALPREDRTFHVFSAAGLVPGYWNFKNSVLGKNPLDRWVNLGRLCRKRGVQLDLYNAKGSMYSRSHAWVMHTYDGLVLIAFEKFKQYTIPYSQEMWFRCYTPSSPVDKWEHSEDDDNPFVYETMTYANQNEMAIFMSRYTWLKAKPGYTGVFHNGAFFKGAPNVIPGLAQGDIVEIWHDPSVVRVETYAYKNLKDFHSDLDKKRKLIIHPPKVKGDFTIRYFDDNDYYLTARNNRGLLLPRNDATAVRQLTHCDVAIADEFIQNAATYHPDLAKVDDIQITVLVRKSDWEYQWPHDHQRLRYLYRMPDADILRAMTGPRALVPEWTANGLESGSVLSFTRLQYREITRAKANPAIGYNAATRVLSETPIRAEYLLGGRGVEIPETYREKCTAWEHDENGKLVGYYNQTNARYYSPVHTNCKLVEFTIGHFGRTVDITVTNVDTVVSSTYDLRVYVSDYNIDLKKIVGPWKDVTGDDKIYVISNGRVSWKGLDRVNQRGILATNKKTLAYTFTLEHIDHSLAFALTEIYAGGGQIFPYSFAEVDLWLNGHPLIENVDWVWDNQYCYINNKEFIVDGAQEITVRAHGFYDNLVRPNADTELGFVDGGVIGRFDRYNLRGDRVTRTVINGALYLTDEVPRAEREVPDDQWGELNGRPYCVKHIYCPVKWVEDFKSFPMRKRSRETDQRVSDYLTEYLPKPRNNAEEILYEQGTPVRPVGRGTPVVPNLQDKYRLYSPFLNVVTNAILNRLLVVPDFGEGETTFSDQQVKDLVKNYIWWLKYDPVILEYDLRYFAIMPYANFNVPVVTAKEFVFIRKANDLFLNSVCSIEGHYEVNDNVR